MSIDRSGSLSVSPKGDQRAADVAVLERVIADSVAVGCPVESEDTQAAEAILDSDWLARRDAASCAELTRLRRVLAQLPHDEQCGSHAVVSGGVCDCWKADTTPEAIDCDGTAECVSSKHASGCFGVGTCGGCGEAPYGHSGCPSDDPEPSES